MVRVKVKKLHKDAKLPTKATEGSACYDVYALTSRLIEKGDTVIVGTGIAFEIPEGYEIEVRPRSSLAKNGLIILNSPGTIDSDYRQELYILLHNLGNSYYLMAGDRIAQIKVNRLLDVEFVEGEIEKTDRGGLGSTGR